MARQEQGEEHGYLSPPDDRTRDVGSELWWRMAVVSDTAASTPPHAIHTVPELIPGMSDKF
jgi:hypothetical protein